MKTEIKDPTWEELVSMESGTILKDWHDEGVRCIIMRGPASLCAYVGIPLDHPMAGYNYDDVPLRCHCGLTFSREGSGDDLWPEGYWWYGWDYTHSGDYSFYYDTHALRGFDHSEDKKWMLKDVEDDMWSSIYDFRSLVKLAEKISTKKA